MTSLSSLLPAPKSAVDVIEAPRVAPKRGKDKKKAPTKEIPPHGNRKGYKPKAPEDFGDGGAFPEIHIAQYPLGLGKKKKGGSSVSRGVKHATADATGKLQHDVVLDRSKGQNLFTRHSDLVPKQLKVTKDELQRPSDDEVAQNLKETQNALQKIIGMKVAANSAARLAGTDEEVADATMVQYTPAATALQRATGDMPAVRVIQVQETAVDPLEPPKFRHRKVTKGPSSPPAPVLHSPNKKLTAADQAEWDIPPCVSNWKNMHGFTIALDKRLVADGRGLRDHAVNERFVGLAESLNVAQRTAREEVHRRAEIRRELATQERDQREEQLREIAARARMRRGGVEDAPKAPASAPGQARRAPDGMSRPTAEASASGSSSSSEEEVAGGAPKAALDPAAAAAKRERDAIRKERARDRQRENRLASHGSRAGKAARDKERDMSERIALGMAAAAGGAPQKLEGEAAFDQRLFNRDAGGSTVLHSDMDQVYDGAMFGASHSRRAHDIFATTKRSAAGEYDEVAAEAEVSRLRRAGVGGDPSASAMAGRGRDGPVAFEKVASAEQRAMEQEGQAAQESDPFGVESFLSGVSKKRPRE